MAAQDWISVVLPAAVLAAVIAGAVNLWLSRQRTREEERGRVRTLFAEAFQAYSDYKEFAYAVRRRNPEKAAEERVRLSEQMKEVQSRIVFFQMWITLESRSVGKAYDDLIRELRVVAGGSIRDGWSTPPVGSDTEMNIPTAVVDLSALGPSEESYRSVVAAHLRR
jgi:hypothetical protein